MGTLASPSMGEGYGDACVSIFNEDLQDVTRSLQRLHELSNRLVARQNLVSARRLVFLFGFLVHLLHVQGETDARKVDIKDVRGEQEEIADVLGVSHSEAVRYPCHGAKDHADLMWEKGFGGSEEANVGHGAWSR